MNVDYLINHRVKKHGNKAYMAIEMDPEDVEHRRMEMKRILRGTRFEDSSADVLDNMIISRANDTYIVEDVNGYEFYYPDYRVSAADTDFRRTRSMMPFEFINLTGKDFGWSEYSVDTSKAKDIVNQYILNFPQFCEKGMGLYIYSGTKGSGKTMLSCCILNELAKRYVGSIKFINVLDFLEMTKKGYRGEDNDIDSLYQAGVLVIDDIGVQMAKEWIDTEFYRLINDRYSNRRPIIYTSNVPIEKLKMDDRATDRIESTTYLVSLPEESIRRIKRQQDKNRLFDEIKNTLNNAATS